MEWWRRPWVVWALLIACCFVFWKATRPSPEWVPGITVQATPAQEDTNANLKWSSGDFSYESLAQFDIQARVLSRKNYSSGMEAKISPMDLALGWGVMSSQPVIDRLSISQSGRWYHYSWRGNPPADPKEMAISSSNMHIIPGSNAVLSELENIKEGSWVRLKGKLVAVTSANGWRWRSSLTRTDVGDGACELFWVDEAVVMDRPPL